MGTYTEGHRIVPYTAPALRVPCPCGAAPGMRCGWWQEPVQNPSYPRRWIWNTWPNKVHAERVRKASDGDAAPGRGWAGGREVIGAA
jgi:hypothetical protein